MLNTHEHKRIFFKKTVSIIFIIEVELKQWYNMDLHKEFTCPNLWWRSKKV